MPTPKTPRRHLPLLLLLVALPATAERRTEILERELEEGGLVRRAHASWWHRQRTFPATLLPPGLHSAAAERLAALAPSPPRSPRFTVTPLWQPIGPAPLPAPTDTPNSPPIAGRMRAVALHPKDPNVLYVAAAQGGVWESRDAGATWRPITDGQPAQAIGALAIDPARPERIWAGTGEPTYFGFYGEGLLLSEDGGRSWSRPAGSRFVGASTSRIVLDPARSAVYVATTAGGHGAGDACTAYYPSTPDLGVFRSTDGGKSFTRLVTGAITDLEIDLSTSPRTLYFHLAGRGAFRMVEGGSMAPLPLPGAGSKPKGIHVELALAPSDPKVLYAGVGLEGRRSTLYRSSDRGQSFTEVPGTPNYCYDQCDFDNVVTVHPRDPGTVFLGGGVCAVFRGTGLSEGRPQFTAIAMPRGFCAADFRNWHEHYVHPDCHDLVVAPDGRTLWVATDGGIARSRDGGATWDGRNDTLSTLQLYGLCESKREPGRLWGGAQDNGLLAYDGERWSALLTGDGGRCVADVESAAQPTPHPLVSELFATVMLVGDGNPEVVFSAYPGYCRKGDPGCGDRAAFIAPLTGDPDDPRAVYVGTHRLYRSTDGGEGGSFSAISGDLSAGKGAERCTWGSTNDDYLTAIAVGRGQPKALYTGSAAGVIHRSLDGGATFQRVDKAPLPGRWVAALAVDAKDPRVVWAAFSGFSVTTPGRPGHVFRSDDGGESWRLRDVPADLPVDALLAHPEQPGVLFAGTDLGVLATVDGGASWGVLDGLPGAAVYDLTLDGAARRLSAATHGRGVYRRPLVPSLALSPARLDFRKTPRLPPAPTTLTVTNGDRSGSVLRFSAAAAAPWVTLTPEAGTSVGDGRPIEVSVDPSGLGPGTYQTSLTVADPASPEGQVTIPVQLTVEGGCGCRLGGGATRSPLLGFALLLVALAARRRRRAANAGPAPWPPSSTGRCR